MFMSFVLFLTEKYILQLFCATLTLGKMTSLHPDNSEVRVAICCLHFQVPFQKLHPGQFWAACYWHGVLP